MESPLSGLNEARPLRHGFTTGACAAAAARGAALMLTGQAVVNAVTITLPGGAEAAFQLHGQRFSADTASCHVVKDAGDDPDVTNGAEVRAEVSRSPLAPSAFEGVSRITISGGVGIGRVTKPGLAIPPGAWAINPVPLSMIEEAVGTVPAEFSLPPSAFSVVISIADGEERALKTLNARLGIIGGLSILGTTGIVRPISAQAWTDTIDAALDVARACGCETVILSTGRSSELAAQKHVNGLSGQILPEEAYIMMGDHLAHAVRACAERGFMRPSIACQFAKLLKIACGHENTHAAVSELDLAVLHRWATEGGLPEEITALIARANTAREVAVESGFDNRLMELVICRAGRAVRDHLPEIRANFMLCGYDGSTIISVW